VAQSCPTITQEVPANLFAELAMLWEQSGGAGMNAQAGAPASASLPTLTQPAMPEYTTRGAEGMAHFSQAAVPEAKLRMGPRGILVRTLFDTGAYYNMMSVATVNKLDLIIDPSGPLPTFALADSHTAPCLGRVHTPTQFGEGAILQTEFMVIADSPFPAIVGSHCFKAQRAVIDYNTGLISLNVGDKRPQLPFIEKATHGMPRQTTTMSVPAAITIPANTEMNVKVTPNGTTSISPTWTLMKDAGNHGVHVAKGITHLAGATEAGLHHHCRVLNASDRPLIIDPGQPLVTCMPISDADFHVMPGDEWDAEAEPTNAAAPSCTAQPISDAAAAAATDKQWSELPHLKDIDLSAARETLNDQQLNRLRQLIIKHQTLWNTQPKETPDHVRPCDFELREGAAFSAKTRPMNEPARESLRRITLEQLSKNIIEPSTSRFSSAVVLVPKNGGGVRFAIDYRALNKEIDADAYTLPNVAEALSSLHGCKQFSAVDMKEAFWSIPLAERVREYTAFQTPDGLMQYRRMPMGLKTASAVFCRHVDKMLGAMKWTKVLAYVDDLLVFGKSTPEEHLDTLDELFSKLTHYGMTLGAKKCIFFAHSLQFLGHIVDRDGVRPDQGKVKAIRALKLASADTPLEPAHINSHKQMEQAVGLLRYYRKFILNFSKVEKPIRAKMENKSAWKKKGGRVQHSEEEIKAFNSLRDALTAEPILAHPDWSQPFEVHTDASYVGLGAVLVQKVDGKERVISYASRSLRNAENNYSVWELECLAIVWALRLFRMYLTCATFTVWTDADAARTIMKENAKNITGRILRWHLAVQEFVPFSIEKRAGKRNGNADGLSRLPLKSTAPYGEGETIIEPQSILGAALAAGVVNHGPQGHEEPGAATAALMMSLAGTGEAFFPPHDRTARTAADFRRLQANDDKCKKMAKNAAADVSTTTVGRLYKNESGLLMRKTEPGKTNQIVVPDCLKAFVLRRYHGLPVSGHIGRRRTNKQLKASYYWPDMSKDVKRWVQACLACRRRKTPRQMHAGEPGEVSNATRPWQRVAIDIVSATTTSQDGCTKILTMIDLFTRYVIAVALRRATAKDVGTALFEHLFCRFGKPKSVHTDDGSEFINAALASMFKEWDIVHTSTGGYQPQANPVERYHRFMNSAMTMLSAKFGANWPKYLPAATFAYNASTNDATGYSSHELVHAGQRPTLLQTIDELEESGEPAPSESEHHLAAGKRLKAAYDIVRTTQEKMAAKNREHILKKRGEMQKKAITHEVGDHVLYWEPAQAVKMQTPEQRLANVWVTRAPQKWKSRWTGPHTIEERVSDRTGYRYTIAHKKRGKIETHINRLCSFQPWAAGLLSTSWDIDAEHHANSKEGEWVETGELVVLPLCKPTPFGVAKVISCSNEGDLELQWLANVGDDPRGMFKQGWATQQGREIYYAQYQSHADHRPYMASDDNIAMNQRDVLLHSFKLTADQRLPPALITAISNHDCIWWSDEEAKQKRKPIVYSRMLK
jgi:hypothetical protein